MGRLGIVMMKVRWKYDDDNRYPERKGTDKYRGRMDSGGRKPLPKYQFGLQETSSELIHKYMG
jgi:hypothetical protein